MTEHTDKAPSKTIRESNNAPDHFVDAGVPRYGKGSLVTSSQPPLSNKISTTILRLQRTIGNQAVQRLVGQDIQDGQQPVYQTPNDRTRTAPPITHFIQQRILQLEPDNAVCSADILADGNLLAFTEAFNDHFRTILHAFEAQRVASAPAADSSERAAESPAETDTPESDTPQRSAGSLQAEATNAEGNRRAGTQSGNELDACTLRYLFTETQREKLMSFFQTREIPDRLFNGDDVGHTTAQQRLLMAAHILANGTYQPGSFEQQVHARMCFHWVHIVHHYAGATPGGTLSNGVMGNFDHAGNIVMGAGSNEQVFFGGRVNADQLPEQEGEGIGPIPEGTGHAETMAQDTSRVHRRHSLPFERFNELQPGDWLWYYNANRSGGGSHSVIFSRWASGEETIGNVHYRTAVCFSQGSPSAGGREHNVNLGDAFFRNGDLSVYPITYVTRVNSEAGPAQSVGDLLPEGSARREERLAGENQTFLRRVQRRFGRPVDLQRFLDHLREENRGHIAAISSRLTENQRELLEEANSTSDIETMIRLTQRLRALVNNSELLERNMHSTYDERLNERHREISERVNAEEAEIREEMAEVDSQSEPIETQIEELNQRRAELDPSARLLELRREAGRIWTEYRQLPRDDPQRAPLRERRQQLIAEIQTLTAQRRENRQEISRIRSQIQALRRQLRPLNGRRTRLERRLASTQATLPYGLVHPGNLGSQDRSRLTGKIQDLFSIGQMEQFVVTEAETETISP